MTPRVLVLDHRDSFVFLLVEQLARLGAQVRTFRTSVSLPQLQEDLDGFDPDLVVLSPGPGHPHEAGVMLPFLETRPALPILGVCLGHQAMAVAAGGRVARGPQPVHGKSSPVQHEGDPLFDGLPSRFRVGRYHSLVVTEVPDCFRVVATSARDSTNEAELVMAMRHRSLPQLGLQFHPESVLTPFGGQLLQNVLQQAQRSRNVPQAHPTGAAG